MARNLWFSSVVFALVCYSNCCCSNDSIVSVEIKEKSTRNDEETAEVDTKLTGGRLQQRRPGPLHPGLVVIVEPSTVSRVGNKTIEIQPNLTFRERVTFFEDIACPSYSNCSYSSVCSPFWCDECSCKECDRHLDCCAEKALTFSAADPYREFRHCRVAAVKVPPNLITDAYYMLDRCPITFRNDLIVQKCQGKTFDSDALDKYLPVSSTETKRVYANHFCAMCHNDTSEIERWQPKFGCKEPIDTTILKSHDDVLRQIVSLEHCFILITPPVGSDPKPCEKLHTTIIDRCNETGTWETYDEDIEKACKMYEHTIYPNDRKTVYRNVFCALCNGINETELLETANTFHTCAKDPQEGKDWEKNKVSFALIFNINQVDPLQSNTQSICESNELYHLPSGRCRRVWCRQGQVPANHSCVDAFQSAKDVGYKVHFRLVPKTVPHKLTKPFSAIKAQYLRDDIYYYRLRGHNTVSQKYIKFRWVVYYMAEDSIEHGTITNIYYIEVAVWIVVSDDISPSDAEYRIGERFSFEWNFDGESWRTTPMKDETSNNLSKKTDGMTLFSRNAPTLPEWYYLDENYILVNVTTRCDLIEVKPSEYSINNNTGDLCLIWSPGNQLAPGEYITVEGGVRICAKHSEPPSVAQKNRGSFDTEATLTLASSIISLLSLSLVLLVCVLTSAAKTVPGKITIVLVAAIFVAQLLYLISGYGVGEVLRCRLLGMAIHYAWLVVFAWKNVAAYHMHAVFTQPLKMAAFSSNRLMTLYSVFGFGLPAVIVACYTLAKWVLSGRTSYGYGEEACFLSQPLDIGVAFVIPVGLVIVANIFLFARTIRAIRALNDFDALVNRPRVRQTALFIKMSVALGFTWVIGFLANVVNVQGIWYAFIVVNGSIGLVIFLCQICNREVVSLVRKSLVRYLSQTPETTGSFSSKEPVGNHAKET